MDKESLIKNHFWILAAVAAVLALVSWVLVLVTGPSSAAGETVAKMKSKWSAAEKYSQFKHRSWLDNLENEVRSYKTDAGKIHGSLYNTQVAATKLMTWPVGMVRREFDIQNGKFAYEIEIHPPKTSLKSLPANNETRLSGTLIKSDQDFCEVRDASDKPVKFLRSMAPKIIDKSDAKRVLNFGSLSSYENRTVTVTYLTGKFFGHDLTESEKEIFRDTYREQLDDVLAELGPMQDLKAFGPDGDERSRPVVLFRYVRDPKIGPMDAKFKSEYDVANDLWIYKRGKLPPHDDNRFFRYVKLWNSNIKNIQAEEVWAAQEDLWVQRELFKQLKAANDALAHFEPVMVNEKTAKPNSFRNFYWEIDFAISDEGVAATLKNLRPEPQRIDGLHFVVRFKNKDGKPGPAMLYPPLDKPLKDFPVPPAGSGKSTYVTKKPYVLAEGDLGEVYSVDQVLTVETAAVKRVDVMAVCGGLNGDMAVSQRQAMKPLMPLDKSKVKNPAPVIATPAADPSDPNAPPPPPPLDPEAFKLRKGLHQVILDRYLEVPTESRKLPVNLVVVVSPEHIGLVEASLVSSPLRFFTTQVLWQRCQLMLPGNDLTKPFAGGERIQENVELSIYGVVTIYQRPGLPAFAAGK